MRPYHLIHDLTVAKEITVQAAAFDFERAQIEAGGYLTLLLSDPLGSSIASSWAGDFRKKLNVMEEVRARVIARLREIRDVLIQEFSALSNPPTDMRDLLDGLNQLDAAVEKEWLGPQDTDINNFSLLFEPLEKYAGLIEYAVLLIYRHELQISLTAVRVYFIDSFNMGDAGTMLSVLTALENDRKFLIDSFSFPQDNSKITLALRGVVSSRLSTAEEAADYVLNYRPRLLAALKEDGQEVVVPQRSLLGMLGGHKAIILRKLLLAAGPRHPWWALVRLFSIAKHSDVDAGAISNDDELLARVARAIAEGSHNAPSVKRLQKLAGIEEYDQTPHQERRLVLELEKVHAAVCLAIDQGREIQASLLRYRQRVELFSDGGIEQAFKDAESDPETRIIERERVAVRHLSTWLFDQGHFPLSKTLGRGKTDLEGEDADGAFVIEAKIVTDSRLPKDQASVDELCRIWANQAIEYAEVQGVECISIVVFNRTSNSQFVATEPVLVGGRLTLSFIPISVTLESPSGKKGPTFFLRWASTR